MLSKMSAMEKAIVIIMFLLTGVMTWQSKQSSIVANQVGLNQDAIIEIISAQKVQAQFYEFRLSRLEAGLYNGTGTSPQ